MVRSGTIAAAALLALAGICAAPGSGAATPRPAVTRLSPNTGSDAGGTAVTITDSSFVHVTRVSFGQVAATAFHVVSSTEIQATTPRHRDGTVYAWVTTANGTSAATTSARFTFGPPPTLSYLSRWDGSGAGGTRVTITGTAFTPDAYVTFGGVRATHVVFGSDTTLTATSPAHAAGVVKVRVHTPFGITGGASYYFYAPPHPLTWSHATVLDPSRGTPHYVSCPTTTFCAFVDRYGLASTYNGSAWSTPVVVAPLDGDGWTISCPAAGHCIAVGELGHMAILSNGIWQAGPTLHAVGAIQVLDCPTSTFCVAGGGQGIYEYMNGAWTGPVVSDDAVTGVSCASDTFCMVVDAHGDAIAYNGISWAAPVQIQPGGFNGLWFVSCPTSTFCGAVGGAELYASQYDGTSWSTPVLLDNWPAAAVSCASPTFCLAVTYQPKATIYNGTSWATPIATPPGWIGGYVSISCASATMCMTTGDNGPVLTYNGATWTSANPDPDNGGLGSVSCASTALCAVADGQGNVATGDGINWSPLANPGVGHVTEHGLSCTSPTFCIVVGSDGTASTFDGHSWATPMSDNLTTNVDSAVSCPTSTNCLAIDAHGNYTRFNGHTWTAPARFDNQITWSRGLPDISCATTSFCAALDKTGELYTLNGATWTTANVGLFYDGAVSCPSASFCVALDDFDTKVSTYDGARWSKSIRLGSGGAFDVSCPSSSFCLLQTWTPANTQTLVYNGTAWSEPSTVQLPITGSFSCVSSSWCLALTQTGTIIGT